MKQNVICLPRHKKIYFASDFHLGIPNYKQSRQREQRIIRWLNHIRLDAYAIYFLGDLFDFWFEYKRVIPKGFIRLQGMLAELADAGINLFFVAGNHDMWMYTYFQKEIGVQVYYKPITIKIGEHVILVGHGDGLGAKKNTYKILKKIYTNPFCQQLFSLIHPDLGLCIAKKWSSSSKTNNAKKEKKNQGKEYNTLFVHCTKIEHNKHHDFYVFGHYHKPMNLEINKKSHYINLGDWIYYNTYAVYDGLSIDLKEFEKPSFHL